MDDFILKSDSSRSHLCQNPPAKAGGSFFTHTILTNNKLSYIFVCNRLHINFEYSGKIILF